MMTLADDKSLPPPPVPANHPAQALPAYSERDDQSDSGYEHINTPNSPLQQTSYMTAEQEKAYLAARDQQEAPRSNDPESPYTPTPTDISRGLQVPTCNRRVSSGFPYPEMLFNYGISPQQWSEFTSEITRAANLTNRDWAVAVGSGVGTVLASSIIVGWLGLIVGAFVGEKVRQSAENKNLRAAKGELEIRLLHWNETVFRPRGFLVRLEMPGETTVEALEMNMYRRQKRSGCCGRRAANRAMSQNGNQNGWWAQRAQKKELWQKQKATKRGRILILPLDVARSSPTAPLDVDQLIVSEKEAYPEVKEV